MIAKQERLAAPDVLRVTAIFMVGWFHIWQQSWLDPSFRIAGHYINVQQVVRHGYVMVDVMLLLSGFLLALPYARRSLKGLEQETPETFYRKRFWRIVPGYYLAIAATLFLWAIPQGLYSSAWAMGKDLWAHFTFTPTLFPDTYLYSPMPSTVWTLAVEVQFYVLWPIVARYYVKKPAGTCLFLALLAFTFRAWVYGESDTSLYFNQLPAMLDLYACGMAAAMVCARMEQSSMSGLPHWRWMAPLGMVLSLGFMVWIMYAQPVGEYALIRAGQMTYRLHLGLLGGAFLVCGHMLPAGQARVLGNPVTRVLADISYGFYIWHQFLACRLKEWHIPAYVSEMPNQAGEQPWQTGYTLMCFFAAAALSAVITYLWEKPIQKWGLSSSRTA